jgi:hypothetical protein
MMIYCNIDLSISRKLVWFWFALIWHAVLDATTVYVGRQAGLLQTERIAAIFAVSSLWIVFPMIRKFSTIGSERISVAAKPSSLPIS